MRAAIYARYSTDLQSQASIGDQLECCRRYAAQQGFAVVATFDDRALSGSDRNRPGFKALLAAARSRRFDIVIVEALDRLTRRLSEIASVFEELQFMKINLHAVNVGAISTMHVGLMGTMAQMFLSDLRDKTKRGQLGRVLKGRVAGGKAFGYDVVPGDASGAGARQINAKEAEVVRRIFLMFAAGTSPRAIAKKLNAEGVPGPDGRKWQDTTIRGQHDRGTGILNNSLYEGRLVWNRCSYIKDPATGKRLARINPPEKWETVEVPELRIVDAVTWTKVKDRQAAIGFEMARDAAGNALNRAHRRKFLLSGLLACGECGAAYTIVGKDTYGCRGHRSLGTCQNGALVARADIEGRILRAIKGQLLAPDLIAAFTQAYQEEVNRLAAGAGQRQADLTRQLASIDRKIAGILGAIEQGMFNPSMKERLTALEAERSRLQAQEATPAPSPISVHPNLAEAYRRKVEELERLLGDPELGREAMEVIRSMITRIDVSPRSAGQGVHLDLSGDLAQILSICSSAKQQNARAVAGAGRVADFGFEVSVVAGAGFEPATFRL